MRAIWGVAGILALSGPGCGPNEARTESYKAASEPTAELAFRGSAAASVAVPTAPMVPDAAPMMGASMMGMMAPGMAGMATPTQEEPPTAEAMARKIIYDAQIDLIVEEIDPAADRVSALVEEHGGYVAEQDMAGSPGSRRSGRWKLRVPVDRFEELVRGLLALGELQRNQRTSQDVTEEYYDVEARIRNKKVEEETLLKILDERSGALEDVLKVEVELSRVRGEVERLQGRLRVLENLSGLATITLGIVELEDFEPPAPAAPDFRTRIARAWEASIADLRTLGENLVLWAVGLAPWLPLILIGLVAALVALRRFLRALPRLWQAARRPIGGPRPTE